MTSNDKNIIRPDHKIILDMIEENSKVLDLGCGDGALLSLLKENKKCKGTGIEIDEKAIYECAAKGVSVSHCDIDTGLVDYSDKRFDYVILNESLQQVLNPKNVILESFRIGKKVIVGIPNFCTLPARIQIFFKGIVPVTKELPYEWYDTPNLKFLSLIDFRKFCKVHGITIIKGVGLEKDKIVKFRPNIFASLGIYLLEKNV